MDEDVRTRASILQRAIGAKVLIEAEFNGARSVLAPHSIMVRGEEPYLKAVTVARPGFRRREPRFGTFKISGLKDLALLEIPFSHEDLFARAARNSGEDALLP